MDVENGSRTETNGVCVRRWLTSEVVKEHFWDFFILLRQIFHSKKELSFVVDNYNLFTCWCKMPGGRCWHLTTKKLYLMNLQNKYYGNLLWNFFWISGLVWSGDPFDPSTFFCHGCLLCYQCSFVMVGVLCTMYNWLLTGINLWRKREETEFAIILIDYIFWQRKQEKYHLRWR